MFDLEQSIADWRQRMLAAGIKTPVPLEELENHLREEIERQTKLGLNEQTALSSAVQRIGQANALKSEFAKAGRPAAIAFRGLTIFLVIVLAAFLVALNIYLAGEPQAICLIDGVLLSFVLPFTAGSQTPTNAAAAKRRSRTAWTGQLLMGLCCLLIKFSSHPVFGLMAALSICIVFALALRQQTRAAVAR